MPPRRQSSATAQVHPDRNPDGSDLLKEKLFSAQQESPVQTLQPGAKRAQIPGERAPQLFAPAHSRAPVACAPQRWRGSFRGFVPDARQLLKMRTTHFSIATAISYCWVSGLGYRLKTVAAAHRGDLQVQRGVLRVTAIIQQI